jgi:hypothetical protein
LRLHSDNGNDPDKGTEAEIAERQKERFAQLAATGAGG